MLKFIIGIQGFLIVLPMALLSGIWITFPVSGLLSQHYSGLGGQSLMIVNLILAIFAFIAAASLLYLSMCCLVNRIRSYALIQASIKLVALGIVISAIGILAVIYNIIWGLNTDPAQLLVQYAFGIVLIPTALHQLYLNRANKPLKNDA